MVVFLWGIEIFRAKSVHSFILMNGFCFCNLSNSCKGIKLLICSGVWFVKLSDVGCHVGNN